MAGIRLEGNTSGNVAEVTTNNELKVALSQALASIGGAINFSQNDAGDAIGTQTLKSPETSQDYRVRIGMDSVLFRDTFNAAAQNTGFWAYTFTTMTAAQPGAGTVNFGAVQGTAANHGAFMRSWRYFPVVGTAPLSVEFTAGVFTALLAANEVWAMGLGLPGGAAVLPTDGVFLKCTNTGWELITRFNNTETSSGIIVQPSGITLASFEKWAIVIGEQEINVWRDDVLLYTASAPQAQGQFFQQAALPLFMQKFCTGSVTNTNTMRVSDVTVTLMDLDTTRDWSVAMAGSGLNSAIAQGGATQGGTSTQPNSTIPTTALPSNTALTANLPAGLGGQGLATLWNLAATDMILNSYTNPAGGINQTPKTLFLTGCRINFAVFSAALTAPAAGTHLFQVSLAFGHTADSLATAESASFTTATAKSPRRKALGLVAITNGAAPIGTPADNRIDTVFSTPIVVNPGERVAVVVKMLNGAATATGGLYYTIDYDGFWE